MKERKNMSKMLLWSKGPNITKKQQYIFTLFFGSVQDVDESTGDKQNYQSSFGSVTYEDTEDTEDTPQTKSPRPYVMLPLLWLRPN